MLTTTLPATSGDGTPEFVLDLAQNMDADVTILAPRVRGCPSRQQMGNVSVIRFRYGPRFAESLADDAILPAIRRSPHLTLQLPGLVVGMVIAAWRARKEVDPDLVHAHWVIPAGIIGVGLTARSDRDLLVTAHGADAFALNDPLSRLLKRFVLRRADRIHAVSTDIANKLATFAPDRSIDVLPIGVNVDSVSAATLDRASNGRLLFVGRLAEKKGVDVLLHALALLRDEHNLAVQLDVIGDGPQRKTLEALSSELELEGQVAFHGAKARADVLDAYRRAELLVIPSKTAENGDRDGTPVVLMEAIAARLPVVASSVGGIAELIEDGKTGWLTPEGDIVALAAAVRAALESPERDAVAQRCIEETAERIDVARIGESLLQRAA